jgi:hypothetical protein
VSLILEGAACCYGGTSLILPESQLSWAKALLAADEYLPLSLLIEEDGFWSVEDVNDSYAEAGSFVAFLVDQYGERGSRSWMCLKYVPAEATRRKTPFARAIPPAMTWETVITPILSVLAIRKGCST